MNRLTGCFVSATALLAAVLGVVTETRAAGRWIALAVWIDFMLRLFAGGMASVTGSTASVCCLVAALSALARIC